MAPRAHEITIGALARRTGLAHSAIRYYEDEGLVHPERTAAGQRRFLRSDIRRLSFVMIAQKLGFPLARIRTLLEALPDRRTPNARDWGRISTEIRGELDARIAELTALRDKLDGCIGCGCLSLGKCALYNPDDTAATKGTGPRYLMGDKPPAR
ncbi:redox-sensitive transcriptional activator SoxR [Sinisalibacter aestuarii]|uniref:MerR family transcriptional regulator n=1 Tax=Sinisalibacter aestuarii TaxID=2949426 RepID=A0ABQ5LP64_9RHOB|nr:redox-sensitive transcriptional activator SoxR [Sinisalibacter aestuarii]GKY86792.1 MerR family transcriptional regulator [Sinisalibacter aestuarii]